MKSVAPTRISRAALTDSARYRASKARADIAEPQHSGKLWKVLGLAVIIAVLITVFLAKQADAPTVSNSQISNSTSTTKKSTTAPKTQAAASTVNHCSDNTNSRFVLVSVSARHMWACEASKTVYDSPVITGMEFLAADLTPRGTYQVYGKYTDTVLRGHDSTGSWNDPVSYWMPFLHNQYGSYGFHDATWRPSSAFGNVDPNSNQASHGCVELPLASAKWLFGWMQIGDSVTVTN